MKILTKTPGLVFALVAAVALLGAGCDRSDPVLAYQAPKDPPPPPKAAPPISWTVPAGWKPLPAGQMRYAAFAVSQEHPDTVVTVIPLPPSPLLANVNRWEGQLGLPPSEEKDLDKVVRHLDLPAGHVDMVELLGPEKPGEPRQRMLGAIMPQGDEQMWFFKLSGPDAVIAGQKENFEAFIRSVKLTGQPGGAQHAHGAAPGPTPAPASPSASAPAEKPVKWTAPPDWVQDAQPRTMRTLSFQITSGERKAEVAVIRLPAQNANQVLAYINIWRGEAGLKPVQDVNIADAKRVTIAGRESLVFDFAGPEGAADPAKRVVVAMCVRGQDIWFFKLFGDAPVVSEQNDAFQKFISSVEFGG